MTLKEQKFNIAKRHKNSYSTYPKASNVEEYCIRKNKWFYQANRTNTVFNISIKTSGERYEFPSKEFIELEQEHFSELIDLVRKQGE